MPNFIDYNYIAHYRRMSQWGLMPANYDYETYRRQRVDSKYRLYNELRSNLWGLHRISKTFILVGSIFFVYCNLIIFKNTNLMDLIFILYFYYMSIVLT